MGKYLKKPVVIEAIQWTGNNLGELKAFIPSDDLHVVGETIGIVTPEGFLFISEGDFIIKGVEGEFYQCKPSIFNKTYDEAK